MELEEMKTLWDKMSQDLEKQKKLTDKLITDMTQEQYNNRLRKISIPETIGAFICFGIAVMLLFYFGKLDTWYLKLSGIFSIIFYLLIPILSLRSIYKIKSINIAKNNYKQTLVDFARYKKHFLFIQKLAIYLSFLLMIVVLPVVVKIMDGRDLFIGGKLWIWYIPIMFIFLFFFSRWGYRCYSNLTTKAENILKELDE